MPFLKFHFEQLPTPSGLTLRSGCIVRNGRVGSTISTPLYSIDIIDISSLLPERLSEKIAQMYEKGHSSRDIARNLGVSKTKVLTTLNSSGIATNAKSRKQGKIIGNAPYGYAVINSELIPDPKEQKNVRLIVSLWQSGKSYNAIAIQLNSQKIRPRTGKSWDHSIIRSIINRYTKKTNN